ncbi:hypothetical protein ACIRD3_03295 [Kitasatospora sp. NPDC093550]|uniref:hypothetical protein n=1 Tax=Kitasatospora sp. NPDC093550 TaxID=3364089 RepID=UPI0037F988FC
MLLQRGADIEALRTAYGPVRSEVVAAALPAATDAERLLLVLRLGLLVTGLSRAAGPDGRAPDSGAPAAARDVVSAATALVTHQSGILPAAQPGAPSVCRDAGSRKPASRHEPMGQVVVQVTQGVSCVMKLPGGL